MAFLDPFEKLTDDLGATFRPQREWVERRGLLLVIGHFLSGVGAGTWLFAWLLEFQPGLVAGIVLVALGGLAHLLFLGRWQRFWRMVTRPQSSWISRGLLGMTVFLIFAILYVLPSYLALPWSADGTLGQAMLLLSLVGMVAIFVYKGFVYAVSKAIPFWDTPLLPFLYIVYALRGGIAVLLVALLFMQNPFDIRAAKMIEFWAILSTAVLILFYLSVMSNAGVATRKSVAGLVAGDIAVPFYVGTIFFGLVIPIIVGALGYVTPLSLSLLGLVGISSLIGDFYIKFCINRAGIYLPLVGEFPVHRG